MFKFLKKRSDDAEPSRRWTKSVFALGKNISPLIAESIERLSNGKVTLSVNDDTSLEISAVILGTALAILGGHSQIMSAERGNWIYRECMKSIQEDYGFPSEIARMISDRVNEYRDRFKRSVISNKNPFGEASGMMLVRCLGNDVIGLCLPGKTTLNPFIHTVVGDLITIQVTEICAVWKDI